MGFQQSLESINYLAVLVAALSAFINGGLWYSVLFASHGWWKTDLMKNN